MLKIHEHTIEVANKDDPLFKQLSTSDLFRHLEHYAHHPHEYFEPLETSEVQEVFENERHFLKRSLHFSRMTVNDRVEFTDNQTMVTEVDGTDDYPRSRLTIKIEMTQSQDCIKLHFIYEEDIAEPPQDDIFLSLRLFLPFLMTLMQRKPKSMRPLLCLMKGLRFRLSRVIVKK